MLDHGVRAIPRDQAGRSGLGTTGNIVLRQEPGDIEVVFAREPVEQVAHAGGGVGSRRDPRFRERLGQLDDRPVADRRLERLARSQMIQRRVVASGPGPFPARESSGCEPTRMRDTPAPAATV